MKKTVNVNIGSVPFVIDQDAYRMLDKYLEDVRSRIAEDNPDEIMFDIESRIAEIFRESLTTPNQVVNIDLVRRTMSVIGRPELFGEKRNDSSGDYNYQSPPKKFYRSRSDNIIAGVCGGVAEYLNIDPTLVRLVTFILVFFGGLSLWVYFILWLAIPLKPIMPGRTYDNNQQAKNQGS